MTDVAKVIQAAEAELKTLEALYEIAQNEVLFVKKHGDKNELREARQVAEITWNRYEVMATFVANLKYEFASPFANAK